MNIPNADKPQPISINGEPENVKVVYIIINKTYSETQKRAS